MFVESTLLLTNKLDASPRDSRRESAASLILLELVKCLPGRSQSQLPN